MVEKFIEYLDNSISLLRKVDHMTYVTYPLLKDKHLIFKMLNEIYTSLLGIINALLQYEYYYKRISLSQDSKTNFQIFKDKCAFRYGISEQEVAKIIEIFNLVEKHKNSPFEFVKKDKIVIMGENLQTATITIEKIKEYLFLSKIILKKVESKVRR